MITEESINTYKTILGVESLPLAWSDKDLDKLGIRSIHCLRRDRMKGNTDGIPYIKTKGTVKYPVISVLEWLHKNTKAGTDSSDSPAIKLKEDFLPDGAISNQESQSTTNSNCHPKSTEELR